MCPTQYFLVASSLSYRGITLLRFSIFGLHWYNLDTRNCFNISPISITRKDQTFTRNPKQQISSSTPQHLSGIAPLTHRHKSILPSPLHTDHPRHHVPPKKHHMHRSLLQSTPSCFPHQSPTTSQLTRLKHTPLTAISIISFQTNT